MDVETNIALSVSCDTDQMKFVNFMRLPSVESIVKVISLGGSMLNEHTSDQYALLAASIIDNRYTYYGWKNYMYCYMNLNVDMVESVIESLCMYCRNECSGPIDCLLLFFRLFYSCTIVITLDANGKYVWRYFNGKVWMRLDKLQVRSMFSARLNISNIAERLCIDSRSSSSLIDSVWRCISMGNIDSYMFCSNFEEECDDKESVFCMNTMAYDIRSSLLRCSLPGDLATLSGDIDPDEISWRNNRQDMMNILSTWMDGPDVANSYLNILAGALAEFAPRYAVINSGTGADGKSTFFHIISRLFGTYCITMPGSGPSIDTKGANDATPVATAMIGKRVFITTDASNVGRLLNSPGFKSVSGGDTTYIRRLHKEASTNSPRLKALVLINTNQTDFVATSINELTRVRIFKWSSKRISTEDRDIIPRHQIANSGSVIHRYENVFIDKFGSCMIAELIKRHMDICRSGTIIDVCPKIRQWTKDVVAPKTILRFMHACTQPYDSSQQTNYDANPMDMVVHTNSDEVTVEDLFMSYIAWRRTGARFSNTDPKTMDVFKAHLEFYYPICRRTCSNGLQEWYLKGVVLKPDSDLFEVLYPTNKSQTNVIQALMDNSSGPYALAASITYSNEGRV